MTFRLRFAARSDVGLLRDGNEDAVYAGPRLVAVADGMGGHAAGEVASRVAIAAVAPLDGDAPADLLAGLRAAVSEANDRLRDMAAADTALEGMGTTLTALLCAGDRLGVVHVGDSRCYLKRDGRLEQITHDHTLVQNLIDEGRITPEEAQSHPGRALITRALDGRDDVVPDLSMREPRQGDRYLLCSDGLSGVVSEQTMTEALDSDDPQQACDRLIELALRGGGPDNISCVVADVVDDGSDAVTGVPMVAGAAADVDTSAAPSPATAAGRAALAMPPPPQPPEPPTGPAADPPGRWRLGGRVALVAGALAVLLAAATGGAYAYIRSQWYVGVTKGPGQAEVAIYQGLSASIAGLALSGVHQKTDLPLSALPMFDRDQVTNGIPASNLNDARHIVANLHAAACAALPTPTPTTTPSPVRPITRRRLPVRLLPRRSPSPLPHSPRPTPTLGSPLPTHTPTPTPTAAVTPTPSPTPLVPGCGSPR